MLAAQSAVDETNCRILNYDCNVKSIFPRFQTLHFFGMLLSLFLFKFILLNLVLTLPYSVKLLSLKYQILNLTWSLELYIISISNFKLKMAIKPFRWLVY